MARTQKEISQLALRRCFTARELEFLLKDDAFRLAAGEVATLDDMERVSKMGANLLLEKGL